MSWKAQYERMLRSAARIHDHDKPMEDRVDDLLHFFMDCWHLKAWIKYDARHLRKKRRETILSPQFTRASFSRSAQPLPLAANI